MFVEPQTGWRHVEVTKQRTKLDFAHQMKWLVDERYPEAKKVRIVLDNLNTHTAASLYEAFAPEEARRLVKKTGVSLHAEARQLVEHGGNRVERVATPMP